MLQAYRARVLLQRLSPQFTSTNNFSSHAHLNSMHTPLHTQILAALCRACDPVANYTPVVIWLHQLQLSRTTQNLSRFCQPVTITMQQTKQIKTLRSASHPSAVRNNNKRIKNKPNSMQKHWSQKSTSGFDSTKHQSHPRSEFWHYPPPHSF